MRRLIPIALNLSAFVAILTSLYGRIPIWLAPVALVAWYLLRGPASLYATSVQSLALAELEELPAEVLTNPSSEEWARNVVQRLTPHGFVARARYRIRGGQHFDFAQRLDNQASGEVATIMAGWRHTPDEGPAESVGIIVFHTQFPGGGELLTTNSHVPALTRNLPGQVAYRLPDITDPLSLYAAHHKLVKLDGRKPVPIVLSDDPLVWERKRHERSIATQVSYGLGVRDERAGALRLTIKGALRATWLLHPWLGRLQDRRSTRAAVAALAIKPA
jgi:hypothetical protein